MTHRILGAALRADTMAFVPAKYPTLRIHTEDGLPLVLVGKRTVVEIFAPSAVCRLLQGAPAIAPTRLRIAQVRRLVPAKAPWPADPAAFLAEAISALEHAAGDRLVRALAAIQDRVRGHPLDHGQADAVELGAALEIHAGGGTIEWIDPRTRPTLRGKIEIQDARLPALCDGLRLPTGSGTLARVQTVHVPKIALTAHERLRLSDPAPASRALDALLAEEAAAEARRGKRPKGEA